MFHSTNKNNESFFGLDISDQSLKIVQLKKHSDKVKMQSFGKYKLKEGIVVHGEIKDNKALASAIKNVINKPILGSINTNNVVACLPESHSFIKLISIDNSPNQLSDLVATEIEKFFPFALNDLYFDWQIINKHANSFDVLVSAAPRSLIDNYISTLQEANLSVIALETESISLCRSLILEKNKQNKNTNESNYAIIDIGATESIMVVCSPGSIIMSMGVDVSGEKITQHIANTLEINRSQAEKAKIICGLDKNKAEGIIHDILIEETTEMAKRIQNIINFYQDNYTDHGPIEKILISGGGSNVKNLKNIISDYLKIEVIDANVFLKIGGNIEEYNKKFTETHNIDFKLLKNNKKKTTRKLKTKKIETISSKHNSSLNYATAIGLALRNI